LDLVEAREVMSCQWKGGNGRKKKAKISIVSNETFVMDYELYRISDDDQRKNRSSDHIPQAIDDR
jgi:hypothetical protein